MLGTVIGTHNTILPGHNHCGNHCGVRVSRTSLPACNQAVGSTRASPLRSKRKALRTSWAFRVRSVSAVAQDVAARGEVPYLLFGDYNRCISDSSQLQRLLRKGECLIAAI